MQLKKIFNINSISKKNLLIAVLTFLALVSLFGTINKGLINGCDFQWHPAKLFWEGKNHYQLFLSQGKWDFLCQGGQYGHLFQVILYPYAMLEWEIARSLWLITNLIFLFLIPTVIIKILNLNFKKSIILYLIFLTCYPSRMTINYGQQSLFVLFFMMLPYISRSNFAYFFSGFSTIKYSTGYIIFLDFLCKREFKKIFVASLPYIFGWIFYSFYTGSEYLINFFEPLIWSIKMNYARDNDLYSLLNQYFFQNFNNYLNYFGIACIFLTNFFLLKQINKVKNIFLKFSFICICPLIFFPHSNYDYVLMFPLLCYSWSNFNFLICKINFYFIIYFFYFNRIVKHLLDYDVLYQPFSLITIIILLLINLNYFKKYNFN